MWEEDATRLISNELEAREQKARRRRVVDELRERAFDISADVYEEVGAIAFHQ